MNAIFVSKESETHDFARPKWEPRATIDEAATAASQFRRDCESGRWNYVLWFEVGETGLFGLRGWYCAARVCDVFPQLTMPVEIWHALNHLHYYAGIHQGMRGRDATS